MTKPLKEELLAWLEKMKQDEQSAPEKYSNCGQLFRLPDGLPIAPDVLTKATAEMYALIEELNRNDGITVIMISHDITAAVQYASHLLHIGDTVFFGTKAEYLRSPQGRLFAAEKGGDAQ